MTIEPKLGTIIGVLIDTNSVVVRPYDSGGQLIEVELTNPQWNQWQPAEKQYIAYFEIGDLIRKPLAIYENESSASRGGSTPLAQRDYQIQGGGGSYVLLDSLGRVSMTDGSMVNNSVLDATGRTDLCLNVVLATYSGLVITASKDGSLTILKKSAFNKTDNLGQISINADKSITLKNEKGSITIDPSGNVTAISKLVQFLSDANALAGNVVTSGPNGTWQFDPVTGAPILGSQSVQASS
jgi:hypothetical protein